MVCVTNLETKHMEIYDVEQGSEVWLKLRAGIPTTSEFSTILAKGEGKIRRIYLLKLVGEIISGEPMENYCNQNMIRGQEMEAEARSYYAFQHNVEMKQIGFVRNGNKGCSPDSWIEKDGMFEAKTAFPHILLEKLLKGTFPSEHKAQCQGALWVCEREWLDLSIYWPKMPTFTVREYRDELYIAQLSREVDRFNAELAETVERVRRYGDVGR